MLQLLLLAAIIVIALVLFVGGWIPVDLVGLLVLAALALTALVTPAEALAGFSSSAVLTVLALFIISAGLSRTGIAYRLGQPLQRLAKSREWLMVAVLMLTASVLSALINTTTVAVLLLPAVMDLARRSGRPPSRLLLPMALGCLLGGPFTGISTPPNMMIIDALKNAGIAPFAIFDFTPITAVIVLAGVAFVVFFGRRLLPSAQATAEGGGALESPYQLGMHVFSLAIQPGSALAGRMLKETRLGSALYLNVLALRRGEAMRLAPGPAERVQEGDVLIVHGAAEHLRQLQGGKHLLLAQDCSAEQTMQQRLATVRGAVGKGSPLVGLSLAQSALRRTHQAHVLCIAPADGAKTADLQERPLAQGDVLTLIGERPALENLAAQGLLEQLDWTETGCGHGESAEARHGWCFRSMHVPQGSIFSGRDLAESRLGSGLDLTVVGIERTGGLRLMPKPQEKIKAGDTLMVLGTQNALELLQALQSLEIVEASPSLVNELESLQVCVTEVLLSPRTTLAGRTLAELQFREHYGLNVLALWRGGHAHRTKLQDMPMQFGDALLVYGPRRNLAAVSRDPDFLVLDQTATQAPVLDKAPIAAAIMLAVILSAILGLVPIAIAALTGAALMVLAGCLSMDEAYRSVEWKVIFLIATLLPLGVAFERTGAAQLGAEALISLVGDLGPRWVVAALFAVTVLGTQIIPTAALVVLMSPVALGAAADLSISPHLLMMTVAMAASASFASPLSHPAHLLVMGPGGYRFVDYVKIGVPLTLVTMLVCVWLLPLLWPA